ncbi:pyridoxamine 5'-phosphate oxidase family protein [Ramlibacter sp. PS4R-6]|uniref:pyridoxamine 5'-phosphate oxidase family protein n=1 Tax=Ramlibacter sp. PS4R-6 TaxID=3133438 RepID=UPI0030ABBECE
MSEAPNLRRADRQMPDDEAWNALRSAYCGRVATASASGEPYVCPMLFVVKGGEIWFHNTHAEGHLRRNVDQNARACFEVDDPGEVFAYGRFACDTGLAYRSVVAYGAVRIVDEAEAKAGFFDALMARYYPTDPDRPRGFYPRLDGVTVYAIAVERITGKQTVLPAAEDLWPARDRTQTPGARPPAG